MARIWSSGFELNSITADVEWSSVVGSNPTIQTSTVRSGTYALEVNAVGTIMCIQQIYAATAGAGPYFVRTYLYITSYPSANGAGIIQIGNSTTTQASIQMQTDGSLSLWAQNVKVGSNSSVLSLNTWYRIEFKATAGSGTGVIEGKIDGTNFASSTTTTIGNSDRLTVGMIGSVTSHTFFDDIAINDSSGTSQTSYPGAGSIVHLHPNGTGDSETAGIAKTGDTPAWKCIDEVTPDDATTFISVAATSDTLDVAIDNSSTAGIGASDTITLVAVGTRGAATTAANCSVNLRLRSASGGATQTSGNIVRSTTGYTTHIEAAPHIYKLTSYTDPTTGSAWTPTGTNSIDNAQIGFSSADATPDPIITTMWALIEYVPAPPVISTFLPRLNLLSVG